MSIAAIISGRCGQVKRRTQCARVMGRRGVCGVDRHELRGVEASVKAAIILEFGGPEVLRYEDVPDPKPRKDQVLVRVRACAMNHLDLWVRKGLPGVKL